MSEETELRTTFERSVALCMAFVCAISLLAIAGWWFNLPLLAAFRPEFIPMAPSTAGLFLGLCGAALLYRVYSARRGIRLLVQAGLLGLGLIVFILALRHFTGLGPDLEQMLVPNPALFREIETARISPLTALGFFLVIPASLLLTGRAPGQRSKSGAAALALVVLIFSGLILLSYLYGGPAFYGSTLIPVAFGTALSFLFLSLGLLMTAGPTCWPIRMYVGSSLNARLMRIIIPASIAIVLLQGMLNTVSTPWDINPALRVAVVGLVAFSVFMLVISLVVQNISKEIERSDQARQIAENALIEERNLLVTLMDNVPDMIYFKDAESRFIRSNLAHARRIGVGAPDQLIGKTDFDIFGEEHARAAYEDEQAIIRSGQPLVAKEEMENFLDGHILWVSTTKMPLRNQHGQIVGTFGISRDITAHKQTVEALRESEEHFRSLYENIPTGMYRTSPDGQILMANPALVKILGYASFEELSKRNLAAEGYKPEYPREEFKENLERNGNLLGLESAWKRKDGSFVYVRENARLVTDENNQPCYYEGTVEDITQRKQAEEALRKSESSLQAILSSTADGILAVGSENEVLYANERFAEIWRIPYEVMTSKNDSILIQHVVDQLNDPQSFLKQVRDLYQSHEESFDTLNFKDGRVFERLSHPLIEGANVLGRVWSFRDITQTRQIEEKLEKERILLRTLIDNIPDRVYVMDVQGRKIISNLADWRASGGKTMEDVIGKTDLDMYPLELAKKFWAVNMDVIGSGTSIINREEPGLDPEGNPVWILSSKVPLLDGQGKIAGLVGVGRDITDRKRLEEEIRSLSLTDELTGLYNRRGLSLLAEQEMKLAYRMKRAMLLFFGDVDGLKGINDSQGHAQGDLALQEIATILKENFRESDILARMGGDEFVALALDASVDSTEILTCRIQAALDAHNQPAKQGCHLSLSIGVARYDPELPATVSELISQADERMYQQKQARKGKK